MKLLIVGLGLLLLTACQGGGASSGGGGEGPARKNLTLKTKEDREYLNFIRSEGSRDQVAKSMMLQLFRYGYNLRYDGISERDVEEQLNKILINCEGNDCIAEMGE